MFQKTIGILAGMGPRSTSPFVDMVVTECQRQYGAAHDEDFPPMMIYSLPTPFFIDKPIDHKLMCETICTGLQRLERADVAFIAVPCNTAHIYYAELTRCIRVPLLNMINEVINTAPRTARRVALLAARPTVAAGIYRERLREAGLSLIASESWQTRTDALIRAIKTSAEYDLLQTMWYNLIVELENAGVDTIILACTDLNVVSTQVESNITMLDATRCLARAVVREWLKG